LQERMTTYVMPVYLFLAEGPSAVWNPIAFFEIERVERSAPAAPAICTTPKIATSGFF
jgi:hypothetical protein